MPGTILALYDCRSKQEYIYRTNKICEITGGSELLSKIYSLFINEAAKNGISFNNGAEWREKNFCIRDFEASGCCAEIVYEGGGNLMAVYKDRETYKKANLIFSKMLLKKHGR